MIYLLAFLAIVVVLLLWEVVIRRLLKRNGTVRGAGLAGGHRFEDNLRFYLGVGALALIVLGLAGAVFLEVLGLLPRPGPGS